jgi:hypothetical protein
MNFQMNNHLMRSIGKGILFALFDIRQIDLAVATLPGRHLSSNSQLIIHLEVLDNWRTLCAYCGWVLH